MTPSGQVEFFIFKSFFGDGAEPWFFTGDEAIYDVEAIIHSFKFQSLTRFDAIRKSCRSRFA